MCFFRFVLFRHRLWCVPWRMNGSERCSASQSQSSQGRRRSQNLRARGVGDDSASLGRHLVKENSRDDVDFEIQGLGGHEGVF